MEKSFFARSKNRNMKIGIDIGGMSAKIGLADGCRIVRSARIPTRADSSFSELLDEICARVNELTSDCGYDFVGISSCGLIDSARGEMIYTNNIRWENKPFAQELHERLHRSVGIANDAKCAALAEAVYGAGKEYDRVCMFTLGTGVGGGFAVNKKLLHGNVYADSDSVFGHIIVERGGRQCTCGRRGCLEAYASATAVMRAYKERTGKDATAKEIFDAARASERQALDTVAEFTDYLADGVADIINAMRPQVVIIGGGLAGSADIFLPQLSELVRSRIYGGKFLPTAIKSAQLGNDAGMIGATLLSASV